MDNIFLKIGDKNYKLEKFYYADQRIGLRLVCDNDTIILTNNLLMKLKEDEVIVRDYGETEGIYGWLLTNKVIGKYSKEITIGINKAKICKLILNG